MADGGASGEGFEGGDPACWLEHVCDRCGRLVDERPRPAVCPACGEPLPDDEG